MSKHDLVGTRVLFEENDLSVALDKSRCIKCGSCNRICTVEMAVADRYNLENTGDKAICINCGQCRNVCPGFAINVKKDYQQVRQLIKDKSKIVVVSTSPAVRVAIGEEFGGELGANEEGRMVALLKKLGFKYVFDVTFGADLTVMEEATDLIHRLQDNLPLPMFTSCCPAWVKFVEYFYPEFLPNLSKVKSPIGMQGAIIKSYVANKLGVAPKNIVTVNLTPCVAKKYEIKRSELNSACKLTDKKFDDNDFVITTEEVGTWAKEEKIDFFALKNQQFDKPLSKGSGAGLIFGNTGGVMEAALRTAYYYLTGTNPPKNFINLKSVRGYEGLRDATIKIKNKTLKVAVVYGTKNAANLLDKIKNKEAHYDFVEVMACPGGCIGGGGQPKNIRLIPRRLREERIENLYKADNDSPIKYAHENIEIKKIYKEFLNKPMSKISQQLLYTDYKDRSGELNITKKEKKIMKKFVCTVCGYVYEGEEAPDKCPICHVGKEKFVEQSQEMVWASEHVVGVAKGVDPQIIEDLRMNFNGECTEVGMYLAMARVAHREGYPEIGMYYERAAMEEAEHAAKFAELLGEVITPSTKENLRLRVEAENGATAGKTQLAKRAKELNLDAIHDTVHEMARDEARHGKAFEGLLKRYFNK